MDDRVKYYITQQKTNDLIRRGLYVKNNEGEKIPYDISDEEYQMIAKISHTEISNNKPKSITTSFYNVIGYTFLATSFFIAFYGAIEMPRDDFLYLVFPLIGFIFAIPFFTIHQILKNLEEINEKVG